MSHHASAFFLVENDMIRCMWAMWFQKRFCFPIFPRYSQSTWHRACLNEHIMWHHAKLTSYKLNFSVAMTMIHDGWWNSGHFSLNHCEELLDDMVAEEWPTCCQRVFHARSARWLIIHCTRIQPSIMNFQSPTAHVKDHVNLAVVTVNKLNVCRVAAESHWCL
jgi:hypothetical protein